jgi:uncharacterized protein (TIGR02145 family)
MLLISAGAYSQNVGVGTAAPVSKLNVEGNGAATEVLRVSNDKNATKDSIMVMTSKGIVGIGTSTPAASSILELSSTTQGFLPPRMTTAQRNAISAPAVGLTIYNSSSNCLETWDGALWYGPCSIQAASYPVGTVFCSDIVTKVVPVLNPATGKTWMDRNLGASRVATSSTDANSYGDLYQWGRRSDGHQCRTSGTTTTLSSSDIPSHGNFILAPNSPSDWRTPQNTALWQGASGTNNPCPTGYRLPTETEWEAERSSWSSNNAAGAFASPLKLPLAGFRFFNSGSLGDVGIWGLYWSSTVSGTDARYLAFGISAAGWSTTSRAMGFSARCIKD